MADSPIFLTTNPVLMGLRGFFGVCPNCGKARIFRGVYALHDQCPHCAIPFERMVGDFTGAAYINVVATSTLTVLVALLLLVVTEIPLAVIMIAGIPATFLVATLFHRPIKGVWVAVLVYMDYIEKEERGGEI